MSDTELIRNAGKVQWQIGADDERGAGSQLRRMLSRAQVKPKIKSG